MRNIYILKCSFNFLIYFFEKKLSLIFWRHSFTSDLSLNLSVASILCVIFLQAWEGKSMHPLTLGRISLPCIHGSMGPNNPWLSIDFSMTPVETASPSFLPIYHNKNCVVSEWIKQRLLSKTSSYKEIWFTFSDRKVPLLAFSEPLNNLLKIMWTYIYKDNFWYFVANTYINNSIYVST